MNKFQAILNVYSFHGATINVTALPYAPYWMTSGEGRDLRHSGIDYNQLVTLSEALNFSFYILPSKNWREVSFYFLYTSSISEVLHYPFHLMRMTLELPKALFITSLIRHMSLAGWS